MKPWRCFFGRHKWERREDDNREKYWACVVCGTRGMPRTGKYASPEPPGFG